MIRTLTRLLTRRALSKQTRDEQGFTLTELMVVLFILGLLTTIVLINVLPSQDKAMVTKARADIATLEHEVERLKELTPQALQDQVKNQQSEITQLRAAIKANRRVFIVIVGVAFFLGLILGYAFFHRKAQKQEPSK